MAKSCTKCNIIKELTEYHIARRYKDGRRQICKECRKANGYDNNPEYKRKWQLENKTRLNIKARESYYENREYRIKQVSERYQRIKHTEEYKLKYRKHAADRRSRVMNRTPIWSNLNEIKSIYMNCPKGYHVDHIIPLKGAIVSGLHVPTNLQYLTAEENFRKSNKFGGL